MGHETEVEARRYHRRQLAVAAADVLVTAAVLVAWLWSGAARRLAGWLAAGLGAPPAVVAGMVLAVGGSCAALTFPLDVLGGWLLPRRAGLTVQSFRGWLADRGKLGAIGGALGLAAAELVYGLLRWSPGWWWLWGAAGLVLGSIGLAAALPVWVLPLFHRVTPLEDPALRGRLLALAARVGVDAAEVSVADLSRKGRTANAAVVGLGRTRRILVSDTLLASFPAEEIEVVLAHELAHHARGHMAQGLAVQAALLLAVLGVTHRILAATTAPLGLAGPTDPAGVPLLALLVAGLGLLTTPIAATWSRRLEREADLAALEVTRAPAAFIAAMERLGRLNLAERRPPRLEMLLLATHPSLEQRIALARAGAAAP